MSLHFSVKPNSKLARYSDESSIRAFGIQIYIVQNTFLIFQAALQTMSCPEAPLPNLFKEIRSWAKNDRTIFDKAQRAFVSYIQAYSKHECKWVLRVKGTVTIWMPDLFGIQILDFFRLSNGLVFQWWSVVYLCIIFESMHSIFALPGWRHECILRKEGG